MKRASFRTLAAVLAAALLAGQLPGGQCFMVHDNAPVAGAVAVQPSEGASPHHGSAPVESSPSHHQHDSGESASCTMLVSCGAPALANKTIGLKAIQVSGHELTLSVASQHSNPTLLSLTPPPRA